MLAAIGAVVLLLAALIAGAVWLTVPGTEQTASISGLSGAVDVRYDTDWVPRIRAGSETDAASALGFLHARDRMFQMELMRRAASGRLSEIAGPATLPIDRMMRTLGLRQRAVADFATLPPDTQTMLEAYARGVNAWIGLKGRFAAPEFLVLGSPERWEATDCLLWAKTMGLWLSMNWRQELARQAAGRPRPGSDARSTVADPDGSAGTGCNERIGNPVCRCRVTAFGGAAAVSGGLYVALERVE